MGERKTCQFCDNQHYKTTMKTSIYFMRRVGDGGLCVCVCVKQSKKTHHKTTEKLYVGMHQERTKVCTNNATWCYSVFSLPPSVELIVQKKKREKKERHKELIRCKSTLCVLVTRVFTVSNNGGKTDQLEQIKNLKQNDC